MDSSVGVVTGYGLHDRGSNPGTVSRLALGATQLPVQWVPRAISTGIKRPRREVDHSHPSTAEVRNGGAIPSLLHILNGIVLN
jgi:hypothetical protein